MVRHHLGLFPNGRQIVGAVPTQKKVREASEALALILRKIYGDRVLGPEYPLVARINTYYIRDILIKFERSPLIERMKQRLRECLEEFWKDVRWRRVRILVDVDPY